MASRKYEQLGLGERIEIYRLQADGKSLRGIAAALGRSASTISRELKRNGKPSKQWNGGYDPQRAQQLMLRRHARGRAHKLERQPELREQVLRRLAQGRRRSRLPDAWPRNRAATASATNRSIAIFIGAVGPSTKLCTAGCRSKSIVAESVCRMAAGQEHPL